jgi:chromosome segregation ATPase
MSWRRLRGNGKACRKTKPARKREVADMSFQVRELGRKLREKNKKMKNVASAFSKVKRDLSESEREYDALRHVNANLKEQLQKITKENEVISESLRKFVRKAEKSESERRLYQVIEER